MCHVIYHVMHTMCHVMSCDAHHVSCDMSCDAHHAGNHTYHVSSSSLVYSSLGMGSPLAVKELPQCYHTSITLTCASVLVCGCGYMKLHTLFFFFHETYGCWGAEARETLSHLATHLAIPMRCTKSQATAAIYGRLSLTLVRSCARALLSRAGPSLVITG